MIFTPFAANCFIVASRSATEKPMWSTALPALGSGISFFCKIPRLPEHQPVRAFGYRLPAVAARDRRDGLRLIGRRQVHVVDEVREFRLGQCGRMAGEQRRHGEDRQTRNDSHSLL